MSAAEATAVPPCRWWSALEKGFSNVEVAFSREFGILRSGLFCRAHKSLFSKLLHIWNAVVAE